MHKIASYKKILAISLPIMLGSAVQNVITLSDSVFLYYYSEIYKMGNGEFASIGFVGVFYLIIAAIGYGFSKGGQIMVARRMGEGRPEAVGDTFYAMTYFELGMALAMFLFMQFGCRYFFALFVDSDLVYAQSLDYIHYRSYGVFFSYIGVAIIALYSGVARTTFIIVDTIVLALVNLALNYCLVFGKFGFPQMGIGGAALASSIAEAVAFVVFIAYIFFDEKSRVYRLFHLPNIDVPLIKEQLRIAAPMVAQSFVGLGSWFFFFSIIENLGERSLAITNLVRMVYLVLSIPVWGLCSGINTLASNAIGKGCPEQVLPLAWRTSKLAFAMTFLLALPLVLLPKVVLYPLLGAEDMSLIMDATPTLHVLGGILALFSFAAVYFNALAGTGATLEGLKIQALCAVLYSVYVYWVVEYTNGGLEWAWASEIFYWAIIWGYSYWFLRKAL
jgi:MATE family multidrug resistance protein